MLDECQLREVLFHRFETEKHVESFAVFFECRVDFLLHGR